MEKNLNLSLARLEDACTIFSLIQRRIEWMKSKNIHQWEQNYLMYFPLDYFRELIDKGNMWILKSPDESIAGAIAILENDDRWPDRQEKAFYLHHLVTDLNSPGAGLLIMKEVEKKAKEKNMSFLRLDCALNNKVLNQWYENLGFTRVGECHIPDYDGNLMEKKLY